MFDHMIKVNTNIEQRSMVWLATCNIVNKYKLLKRILASLSESCKFNRMALNQFLHITKEAKLVKMIPVVDIQSRFFITHIVILLHRYILCSFTDSYFLQKLFCFSPFCLLSFFIIVLEYLLHPLFIIF